MVQISVIEQMVGSANLVEWAKLALSGRDGRVLRMTRLRHDDHGRPVTLEKVVLALDFFPGLVGDGAVIADVSQLAQRYGLSLSRASERISVVPAAGDIALHLGIAAGADVLQLDRTIETTDGVPIEWRVAFSKL